jgi:multicomponent Na+:H+ antiporter subunit D
MNLLVLPAVLPLAAMAFCLLFHRNPRAQRWISGIAAHALLPVVFALFRISARGEVPVLRLGDWPGSFGIVFAVDRLGALMLVLSTLVFCVTWWFARMGALGPAEERSFFHPLFLILGGSVNWAFLTADLFNLFVSFEILLLSSYALLCLNRDKFNVEESIRFVALNAVGGTLFLAAAGLTYGRYGTLNFADLAIRVRVDDPSAFSVALGSMLLVVFGMKAALFPLFFWLPDSYPRAPIGILPYFAGILTKVGVYCLFRVFTLIFRIEVEDWFSPLLLAIAGATMLVGVLGAFSRWSIHHILSFHIISQIGYMIFGLGLFTELGLASGIFYIAHHILVKAGLFFVGGYVLVKFGTDRLKEIGGLTRAEPVLSVLFLACAFSLAGIPPLSGFYGKFGLAWEGLSQARYLMVGVSILTSLLTLASMLKIWTYVFWGEPSRPQVSSRMRSISPAPVAAITALSLAVAVLSGPLMGIAEDTARQLLDSRDYIGAILGEEGVARISVAAGEGGN